MSVIIQAGKRNPQVYRKLIRFKGCLAGNIVDKTNESIVPIEFLKKYQEEILKANGEDAYIMGEIVKSDESVIIC